MARDGSGNYSFITSSWSPAVNAVSASTSDWNVLLTDIKNGLTQSVSSDGQTVMTNNFNMGGFKVSNAANAVASTDLVALGQMNTAITAGVSSGITGKVNKSGDTMTGGLNLARSSIVQNATTMDLFALSNTIDGTGSAVVITAIVNAPQNGARRFFYPIVGTTITNNAMFAVDGAASYVSLAGDELEFESVTTSTYKVHITKADGTAITATTARPPVPVRQAVLNALVDTAGLPNFMTGTTTTTLTVTGSAGTPFVCTSSNGADSSGSIDRIGSSAANLTLAGFSTNGTFFILASISAAGVITLSSTSVAPIYQHGGTPAVTSGLLTFNIQQMQAFLGNGTTAPQAYTVVIGELVVAANVISTVTPYALMGRYVSALTATLPAITTKTTANHNIGLIPRARRFVCVCTTADQGFATGEEIQHMTTRQGASGIDLNINPPSASGRNNMFISTEDSNAFITPNAAGGGNTGLTAASWSYRFEAERGW